MRFLCCFTALLVVSIVDPVASQEDDCILELGDALTRESKTDLCAEANEAIDTVKTRTLDRVTKKAVQRDLARYFRKNPEAFGGPNRFVYVPEMTSVVAVCCKEDQSSCVTPNENGTCPDKFPARSLCTPDIGCIDLD